MAKLLNTNFLIRAPKPIDSRMQVETYANLDAIPVKYNHMVTHVIGEDADYKYYSATNTWVNVTVNTIPSWSTIIGDITTQADLMAYFTQYALAGHTHPATAPEAHTHVELDIIDLNKYTKEEVDTLVNLKASLSTGIVKSGGLTINSGNAATFDIAAGIGILTEWSPTEPFAPPVSYLVAFGGLTAITPTFLATKPATYIGIAYNPSTETATVVQSDVPFNATARRSIIVLGSVEHSNNTVIHIANNEVYPSINTGNQIHDLAEAVGMLNLSGNIYSANGANLSLNKSQGLIYKTGINYSIPDNPSNKTIISGTSINFRYRLQNSTEYTNTQLLDPDYYDVNGVRTLVPTGKFTTARVYLLANGQTRIQYGQVLYDSILLALSTLEIDPFIVDSHITTNGVLRAFIIIKQGTTSLLDTTKVLFVHVDKQQRAIKPLQAINEDKHYVHTQSTSNTIWTIVHNMGKYPSSLVKDGAGNTVNGQIDYVDLNNLTITFNTAFSGTAYLN